jgi:GntR family transcriptional regulator, gluconate operon transcriptional repressor
VFVRYVPTLRALLRLDERVLASLDDVALQHRQLVDAIDRRDPEEAARLAEEHVDHAAELVGDYLARAVG